ncbi:MAG: hypothetical protein V1890_07865 [Candidatus Zixiibacteriota bacterium]
MKKLPSAPRYQWKPFSYHIDGGFGAIGNAFKEAASRLEKQAKSKPFYNSSLPIAYLHRHASELLLKSCVVVIHRGLKVPFGNKVGGGQPAIKVAKDWVAINRVHSIGDLYRYFTSLVREHMKKLSELTIFDWSTIPQELEQCISQIEEFDKKSTFFRYPGSGNEVKADFKESSVAEIWASMAPDKKPVKGFLELDENDRIIAAYCLDPSRLQPILETLRKTSETLDTLHFALRSELGNGN